MQKSYISISFFLLLLNSQSYSSDNKSYSSDNNKYLKKYQLKLQELDEEIKSLGLKEPESSNRQLKKYYASLEKKRLLEEKLSSPKLSINWAILNHPKK